MYQTICVHLAVGGRIYLFEFKVAERGREGVALAQLREMGYADKYRRRSVHLVEFSREERNVVGLRGRLNGFPFGHFDSRLRERPPPASRARLVLRRRRRPVPPPAPTSPTRSPCASANVAARRPGRPLALRCGRLFVSERLSVP